MNAVLRAAILVAALACRATPAPAPPAPTSPVAAESVTDAIAVPPLPDEHGLRTIERWVGGAQPGDHVPVIVAVHGLGDSPERFAWMMQAFPEPARIVLPAGPTGFGDGFAWMTIRTREGKDEALARQIDASAARVAALCRDLAREGREPVLTGFSQGGMVAWAVAARHPQTIAAAMPIGGYLSPGLEPVPAAAGVRVVAFHGEDDSVVPIAHDRAGLSRFEASGGVAELRAYPGLAHVISPGLRRDLYGAIAAAAPEAAPAEQAVSPGTGAAGRHAPRVDPGAP